MKERIEELKKLIREYDYNYYILEKAIISDTEYDKLKAELERLQNQHLLLY